MVVSASNPARIRLLFRSDELVRETGETIVGNEWWCLDGSDGMDVEPLNDRQTAFRDITGEIFLLEAVTQPTVNARPLNRIKPSPAPDACSLHRTPRTRAAGAGRRIRS